MLKFLPICKSGKHGRQLTSMISHLPGFVYRCKNDEDWSMHFISESCEKVTGYNQLDFLNKKITFNDIILPEARNKVRDAWNTAISNQSFFEYEYPIKDASGNLRWIWERGKGVYDAKGNLLFLEGYIEDFSERKKAENKLRASEERYRLIMDNSQDAIVLTTRRGKVISANKAACSLFGMTEKELCLCEPTCLVDVPQSELNNILDRRERNKSVFGELVFIRKDGSKFQAEVTSSVFIDSNGEELAGMIIRDVTRRKQYEQLQQMLNNELLKAKLKAEESDRLKTSFLANMSHEIRTPMNGILGFLELLKEPNLADESRQEYIELVNISGQRLLSTINDIIEISKIESGEMVIKNEEIDLNNIIQFHINFFSPQAIEKGLKLLTGCMVTQREGLIISDRQKIDSILINLIKNAIKFTKAGYIETGSYLDDNKLVIYVKDTGVGVPEDKQESIFARFVQADDNYSREFEGSGLGLTIVKSYCEALGGKIWLHSEPGAGSTFYVQIPYFPSAAQDHTATPVPLTNGSSIHDLTILIAEDDDISYRLLQKVLSKSGVKIIHVENGRDAVDSVRQTPQIDMVLMDIKMPVMDGLEATRQIRQFNASIPIIAQTAYTLTGDKALALDAGCNDYISKPVNKIKLLTLVSRYIPARSAEL